MEGTPPSSGFGIAIFVEAKPLRRLTPPFRQTQRLAGGFHFPAPRLTSTSGSFSKLNTGILTATVGAGG